MMCLGELAQAISLNGPEQVIVTTNGRTHLVSLLTLTEPVEPGDWLVIHAGFALARLDPDEAGDAAALRGLITNTTIEDVR